MHHLLVKNKDTGFEGRFTLVVDDPKNYPQYVGAPSIWCGATVTVIKPGRLNYDETDALNNVFFRNIIESYYIYGTKNAWIEPTFDHGQIEVDFVKFDLEAGCIWKVVDRPFK